jgi:RNA polymerase sigma-70 factor, ECF subfamily
MGYGGGIVSASLLRPLAATPAADAPVDAPVDAPGALLGAAQSGDPQAFRALVCAHQTTVYSAALRMLSNREDAQELAQDVFLQLFQALGELRGEQHVCAWLRRTVYHRAIDRLRRRRAAPLLPLDAAAEVEDPSVQPEPATHRRLRTLVAQLTPAARAVVLLRYQHDCDPPQIAATLGLPLNTVKSHLRRSLAVLRARCGRDRDE